VSNSSNSKDAASDLDLYDEATILNPYPAYRQLRDSGAAVYLSRANVYAVARYDDVTRALRDHGLFSSASGVSVSERVNAVASGTLISSDPPEHDRLRRIMAAPITPGAIKLLRPRIEEAAANLVADLIDRPEFDAVTDLAQILPVSIVSHLVGLPEEGRENMLQWAAAAFNLNGPGNERSDNAWPAIIEMRDYAARVASRGAVRPGSWADGLIDLVERGEVEATRLPALFRDYMAPSLDTTINATASLLYLLGSNPEQWQRLVDEPSLAKNAINEAVRLESPIRGFTRIATADCKIGEIEIAKGKRVLLLYGSANRDERKWEDPEHFDICRKVGDQVGFGFGVHSCAGMHLARLEIECILQALLARVRRLSIRAPVWAVNNNLRGLASMPMKFEPL
jgi:cytochrome P450